MLRQPETVVLVGLAIVLILMPGHGLLAPAGWFGEPRLTRVVPLACVIFCAVYFGTLKFWHLLTGDRLEKPLPALLALFLAVRLIVDCSRLLMWW